MTIVQQVDRDLIEALKAREAERLGALRMAKTALKLRETEVRGSLSDEEAVRVLTTLIKPAATCRAVRAARREDLALKEEREAQVVQAYLPAAASTEDVTRAVEAAIAETGAISPKDMGAVPRGRSRAPAGRDRRRQGSRRPREGATHGGGEDRMKPARLGWPDRSELLVLARALGLRGSPACRRSRGLG